MLLFAAHCLDHADALARRLANYDAHKAYLAGGAVATVICEPLVAADDETMIGSLFVFSPDSIADVRAFNAADPFMQPMSGRASASIPFCCASIIVDEGRLDEKLRL